jgi:hypothetical protein
MEPRLRKKRARQPKSMMATRSCATLFPSVQKILVFFCKSVTETLPPGWRVSPGTDETSLLPKERSSDQDGNPSFPLFLSVQKVLA